MAALQEYIIPYIISNVVFALSIIAVWKRPYYTRMFFILLFFAAAYTNFSTAYYTSQVYLDYGGLTFLSIYKKFIYGYFSAHIQAVIFSIAACQLLIAIGLSLNKIFVKTACIGGIIFAAAVAPLGVGSAFPSTVFLAVSLFILMRKDQHEHIWKNKQYLNPKISQLSHI